MNYAKELPLDKKSNVYAAPPAFPTNQSQAGVPIASSVLTLSDKTTVLQVMAIGGASGNAAILGKWGVASVTSSNFDFMVMSGQNIPFVVPQSVYGVTSVSGANVANGLYSAVALKAATSQSCSVFTAEY